ncbi:MAG: hypothetical protein ABI395_10000 [Sphingobium sp.]
MRRNPNFLARLVVLGVFVGVAGCGAQHDLEPRTGTKPVPVAVGATKPATANELMTSSPQVRPDHSVEPLIRSRERQDDYFDLPPASN